MENFIWHCPGQLRALSLLCGARPLNQQYLLPRIVSCENVCDKHLVLVGK